MLTSNYPDNWTEIATAIKQAAGYRCDRCRLKCKYCVGSNLQSVVAAFNCNTFVCAFVTLSPPVSLLVKVEDRRMLEKK